MFTQAITHTYVMKSKFVIHAHSSYCAHLRNAPTAGLKHPNIGSYEMFRDMGDVLPWRYVPKGSTVIYISHEWPGTNHPDPDGTQMYHLLLMLERLRKGGTCIQARIPKCGVIGLGMTGGCTALTNAMMVSRSAVVSLLNISGGDCGVKSRFIAGSGLCICLRGACGYSHGSRSFVGARRLGKFKDRSQNVYMLSNMEKAWILCTRAFLCVFVSTCKQT